MSSEGNPGINKLANTLSGRMKEESSSPLVLDFGSINGDYSLQTNTFPIGIPRSSYTVCRQLTLGGAGSTLCTAQGEDEEINVPVPDSMRSVQPGDRVLVAWVQNEAVVIDIIMPASQI